MKISGGGVAFRNREDVELLVVSLAIADRPARGRASKGLALARVARKILRRIRAPPALVVVPIELGLSVVKEDLFIHVGYGTAASAEISRYATQPSVASNDVAGALVWPGCGVSEKRLGSLRLTRYRLRFVRGPRSLGYPALAASSRTLVPNRHPAACCRMHRRRRRRSSAPADSPAAQRPSSPPHGARPARGLPDSPGGERDRPGRCRAAHCRRGPWPPRQGALGAFPARAASPAARRGK